MDLDKKSILKETVQNNFNKTDTSLKSKVKTDSIMNVGTATSNSKITTLQSDTNNNTIKRDTLTNILDIGNFATKVEKVSSNSMHRTVGSKMTKGSKEDKGKLKDRF